MGLGQALTSAVSGLRVTQSGLSVIASNIANAETPDNVRNHPALKGVTLPERTGEPGRTFLGTLVTKTLVVIGDGGFHTNAKGERGALLRAYDKTTGADVGGVFMPAPQVGSPISYLHNGKQYIVLAISGGNYPAELIAFALP